MNSASSAAALVFYLPCSGQSMKSGVRGKTEKGQSSEYILKFSKKTQYLMNTLYMSSLQHGRLVYEVG